MSSIITKKKTVVLFTPGLGAGGSFFNPTINNLSERPTKVVAYSDVIDMKDFQVSKNRFVKVDAKGYLVNDKDTLDTFTKQISAICTMANNNPNKSVLVRVDLKTFPSFSSGNITHEEWDSVSNQASKLAFIVKAIKTNDSSINVILVGHSQGGLVNLETATRIPDKIKRLISISTPYREVLAADLLTIVLAAARYMESKASEDEGEENDLIKFAKTFMNDILNVNCQNRVSDLASEPFFSALHAKWNALSTRPPLTVITGTSGHLVTFDLGVIRTKQSFDGLVRTSEQKGVEHAKFINLADISIPCHVKKTYTNDTCHDSLLSPCNYLCPLPNFGLGDILTKSTFMAFVKSIRDNDMNNFANNFGEEAQKIYTAIEIGLGWCEDENAAVDPLYKNYHDIYASDYSHLFLPECDDTIGILLSEFDA